MKHSRIRWMLAVAALAAIGHQIPAHSQQVEFAAAEDEIKVLIGGKHAASYRYEATQTKPILYPVNTLGGIAVNRGFPLEPREGESRDHPHHVGLFFTYDDVNKSGFWNNRTTPPQVKHLDITAREGGANRGRLGTRSHWIARDGETVLLEENRTMTFEPVRDGYLIDFDIELKAETKVRFGDTKEGMFAIRVADWLRERNGSGRYFSSEGTETERDVWGQRARWMALRGTNEGRPVTVAILNHPSSVNYPTYWHARGYGLFSANPLGQGEFQRDRRVENPEALDLTLEPGETARFRFLMLVIDAARTAEEIEARFQSYAR